MWKKYNEIQLTKTKWTRTIKKINNVYYYFAPKSRVWIIGVG